jgi:transcriptional regulator with XRE-family HTH domain
VKYDVTTIKKRIINEIKARGLSVRPFLTDIGISKNTLDAANKSMPKADTLALIADGLEVSVDYLLGRDNFSTSDAEHALLMSFYECSESNRAVLLDLAQHYADQERRAKEKENA